MSLGRIMALDYGSKRIGVALSDPSRLIAQPLTVLDAEAADLTERLGRIAAENDVDELVVGLPVALGGHEGPAAEAARKFGEEAAEVLGLPLVFVDERFTTIKAEGAMLEANVKRKDRRAAVDKVAAAVILQHYLESR